MSGMSGIRWTRCLLAGLGALAASVLLATVVVFGYAFLLAIQMHGAPDQSKIREFAAAFAPAWGSAFRVAFTVVAAWWASRRVGSAVLQGVVVGTTAAVAGLAFAWPPGLRAVIVFVAVLAAGVVGGLLGSRRSALAS
jgi:hypothetical protein